MEVNYDVMQLVFVRLGGGLRAWGVGGWGGVGRGSGIGVRRDEGARECAKHGGPSPGKRSHRYR